MFPTRFPETLRLIFWGLSFSHPAVTPNGKLQTVNSVIEDTEIFNLEHVIPLTPGDGWELPPEIIQGYTKRLGNMTISIENRANPGFSNCYSEPTATGRRLNSMKLNLLEPDATARRA
ncbi:MAG: DUF1524 domain-containing protein [Alphaproteobacteria bacterium]|nr:DUF1524 domain-containing protein [Alphaproteobacteria bacterium]